MDAREIPGRADWVPELQNPVPDEQARHQNACKWKQVSFHIPTDLSELACHTTFDLVLRLKIPSDQYLVGMHASPTKRQPMSSLPVTSRPIVVM